MQEIKTKFSRMKFLVGSIGILFSLSVVGVMRWIQGDRGEANEPLEKSFLKSVYEAALPSFVSHSQMEEFVSGFQSWIANYDPAAARNHNVDEWGWFKNLYLGPSPLKKYHEQVKMIRSAAQQNNKSDFETLGIEARRRIIELHLGAEKVEFVPLIPRGNNLVQDLLSLYYKRTDVYDQALGKKIGVQTCRGFDGVHLEPSKLG